MSSIPIYLQIKLLLEDFKRIIGTRYIKFFNIYILGTELTQDGMLVRTRITQEVQTLFKKDNNEWEHRLVACFEIYHEQEHIAYLKNFSHRLFLMIFYANDYVPIEPHVRRLGGATNADEKLNDFQKLNSEIGKNLDSLPLHENGKNYPYLEAINHLRNALQQLYLQPPPRVKDENFYSTEILAGHLDRTEKELIWFEKNLFKLKNGPFKREMQFFIDQIQTFASGCKTLFDFQHSYDIPQKFHECAIPVNRYASAPQPPPPQLPTSSVCAIKVITVIKLCMALTLSAEQSFLLAKDIPSFIDVTWGSVLINSFLFNISASISSLILLGILYYCCKVDNKSAKSFKKLLPTVAWKMNLASTSILLIKYFASLLTIIISSIPPVWVMLLWAFILSCAVTLLVGVIELLRLRYLNKNSWRLASTEAFSLMKTIFFGSLSFGICNALPLIVWIKIIAASVITFMLPFGKKLFVKSKNFCQNAGFFHCKQDHNAPSPSPVKTSIKHFTPA